jgi:hypothetical protein
MAGVSRVMVERESLEEAEEGVVVGDSLVQMDTTGVTALET